MPAAQRLELDDIQALILNGFKNRPHARYALLEIEDPEAARNWLKGAVERVATANQRRDATGSRLNIAFTFKGLAKLGLEPVYGFVTQFREGMITEGRSIVLGDTGDSSPENWKWGNGSLHVLLLLFSEEGKREVDWHELDAGLGWAKAEKRLIDAYLEPKSKEAFGFVDGISQPYIEGSNTSRRPTGDEALADVIKAGEFILGYLNENDSVPVSPEIDNAIDPQGHLRARPTPRGRLDFGRNGTYLVLRQLHQKVTEFLHFVADCAQGDTDEAKLLAAKMVGRWPSGAPLVKAPDADREALAGDNDFRYHDSDPLGHACPIGAHIRRANPRDSVGDAARATPERALRESRQHRLIRRGRRYDDGGEQGLMFVCLNASIEKQFEFVQSSWINERRFGGLDDETDPLVGPRGATGAGAMTIQSARGNRRLTGLDRFVEVQGGDYFFLPGIRALRCLADLPG